MKLKPPLKSVNGTILVQTKLGWRDIKGMKVMLLRYEDDKPRFKWGFIRFVVENRVQIAIPSYRPGQDDKFFNTTVDDSSWVFVYQGTDIPNPSPRTLEPTTGGPRCKQLREAIHPVTQGPITLQCVMRGSHLTHHYENPSNETRNK